MISSHLHDCVVLKQLLYMLYHYHNQQGQQRCIYEGVFMQ
jgi:hypothetical protein